MDLQSTQVEGAPAGGQPPDASVVAFSVASAGELHDDGADLQGRQERRDLFLPGRLRGGPRGTNDLHVVLLVEELPRGEAGLAALRGREVGGTAVAVRDPEAVAERFAYYLRRNTHDGRFLGVGVDRDGKANPRELACAVGRLVMIRTVLDGEPHAS